ncbi:MAG: UBA/ThiF-type NAD/FAD binding protein [uncultured bacterium]|nr:MAG: UBA/ThiF-type NAD/FAD binding protein [uncultured bacterium]
MKSYTEQLSDEELNRYRRQIILKEIGVEGQLRLAKSKVIIIGAGGLGSPITLYLAAAGVGKLGIVDHDTVNLSNLQRQILYSSKNIGQHKAVLAKKRLRGLNPEIGVLTNTEQVSAKNVKEIISGYDLVINAVDNIETRYIVNEACIFLKLPLIEGAIYHFEGYVMTIIPGLSACYRCLFPDNHEAKKEEIGVIGAVPGVIGTLQAMEAIKYLLNFGRLLKNSMIYYNGLEAKFREIKTQRNPNCIVCSKVKYDERK